MKGMILNYWSYWRTVMYVILKKEKVWDIVIGTKRAPAGVDATDAAIDEFVKKTGEILRMAGSVNIVKANIYDTQRNP